MSKIVLLDGNSIMFRAYYATAYTGNLMKTSNDLYTNAIYGFVNMMHKVLSIEGMTHIFVAFDKGKKTFRHQAYTEYKGGRKPMPEEFAMQIPYIKEYLHILGVKQWETDEYEADDLIGSMSEKVKDAFDEVIVISGDKDLLQLVRDNVKVFLTKKGITDLEEYNIDNFQSIMGFQPHQMTDYKGLIGDNSDNLPGLSGVGPKTAVKLLEQYQSLENLIAHEEELKGKLKDTLANEKEIALRTKYLATIAMDAPIAYTIEDLQYRGANIVELRSFYETLEFQSFIKKMNFTEEAKVEDTLVEKKCSYHYNELEATLAALEQHEKWSMEVELNQENYHKGHILGIAFFVDQAGYYLDESYLNDIRLQHLLESQKIIYTIDSKKVYVALARRGIFVESFAFDFILASYVVDPSYGTLEIKTMMEKFLPTRFAFIEEIFGKKSIYEVPEENVYATYMMDKISYLEILKEKLDQILEERNQMTLLYEIEIPLAIILGKVEMTGFRVSKERLQEIGVYLQEQIQENEKAIFALAGHPFNVASPKQLGVVLFEEMHLGKGKKTKTGYSTSAEVLEGLAKTYPIASYVLEYRKFAKLYSTYVVGLLAETTETDDRVHTIFKQSLTLTGRLSSTEPNIQNIPIRTEEGRIIRTAFIPSCTEHVLLSADYSQIELRILASLSGCKAMIQAFNEGIDLHALTASKVYNIALEQVTKEHRRVAKAVNFGIVYGMSDWGLAEQLHISPYEASDFIRKYFDIYPEIKTYLNQCVEDAKKDGYTTTKYNRRRYMKEINSSNAALRKFSERAAMNAPIQGTAADIMKIAMIKVQEELEKHHFKSRIVAQVHDELILDVVPEELEELKVIVPKTMQSAVSMEVKFIAEVAYGKTWDMK
ncbi:MAG: DNA polymerase I [Prevotella sp.]|nr:DNA polymerase I [Staphylococcus sp.]MCM1350022.1 DNA polymerase I [Prevotella sp.]